MHSKANVRGLARLGPSLLVAGVVGCGGAGGIESGMPKDTTPPAAVPDVMKTGGAQKPMTGGGGGGGAAPGKVGGPGMESIPKK
jgi:hypothetical protein